MFGAEDGLIVPDKVAVLNVIVASSSLAGETLRMPVPVQSVNHLPEGKVAASGTLRSKEHFVIMFAVPMPFKWKDVVVVKRPKEKIVVLTGESDVLS